MDPVEMIVRYTYHAPTSDQVPRYEKIRARALDMAQLISDTCPDSRERDRAFDALDDVVFNANAAIARRD